MNHAKLIKKKLSAKVDPEAAPPHIRRQLLRIRENDPEEIKRQRRERARYALNKANSQSNDGGSNHKRRRKRRSDFGKPRGKRGSKPGAGATVSADGNEQAGGSEA